MGETMYYLAEYDGSVCRENPNGPDVVLDEFEVITELNQLRTALQQSACDLSIASSEILNLSTHSERERVAADRVAQFCHSQSEIARAALPAPEPSADEEE